MQLPWRAALNLPATDEKLRSLVRITPAPIDSVDITHPDCAAEQLRLALKRLYDASDQDLAVMRKIVGLSDAFAEKAYPSIRDFFKEAGGKPQWHGTGRMKMVTGHPGTGKTHLLCALARLTTGRKMFVEATPSLPRFPVNPLAYCEFGTSRLGADLLNGIAEAAGVEPCLKSAGTKDVRHLRLKLHQVGNSAVILDESQFFTTSSNANALVASTILRAAALGRPIFYGGNFSLANKLVLRPPEDIARLLPSPIVMLPLLSDDPGWRGLIESIQVVLGPYAGCTFAQSAEELNALLSGLRRCLVHIFEHGFRAMLQERAAGATPKLTMDHLRKAYYSVEFYADRTIIEGCRADLLGLPSTNKRFYHCPFELPPTEAALLKELASREKQRSINAAQDLSMHSAAEVAQAKSESRQGGGTAARKPKPEAQRIRRPATVDEFLRHLDDL